MGSWREGDNKSSLGGEMAKNWLGWKAGEGGQLFIRPVGSRWDPSFKEDQYVEFGLSWICIRIQER